jgi:hypothetical protein
MSARGRHAYVWQRGRFDGDMEFWRARLGPNCRFDSIADGKAMRFFLDTPEEFEAFWRAYREELPKKTFHHEPPADAEIEPDPEGEA